MSDFLGRLVQRSLTTSPTHSGQTAAEAGLAKLIPRLPSLFETPGGEVTAPPATPLAAEDALLLDDRRGEPEQQGPSRTLAPPPHDVPAPVASARPGPPASAPHGSPPLSAREAKAREPAAESAHRAAVEPQAREPAAESARRAALEPQIIHHEPADVDQPPREAGSVIAPQARLMPVPPAPLAPVSMGEERRAEAGGAASHSGEPRGTTVRINIGRIEVRAVQPPQPSLARRNISPTPRLTLEEYAKQRNEGKR